MPIATVNGKKYKTVFDRDGVERFPANPIIVELLASAKAGEKFNCEDIDRLYQSGAFTTAQMHEFYRLIGYSTCGFADVFPRDRVKAVWKKKRSKR